MQSLILFSIPVEVESLRRRFLMCGSQLSLSSTIIPKNFVSDTCFIGMPFIDMSYTSILSSVVLAPEVVLCRRLTLPVELMEVDLKREGGATIFCWRRGGYHELNYK